MPERLRLTKDSIDLGIVTANGEAMIAFYRDVLGMEDVQRVEFPGLVVQLLGCGTSRIKIVCPEKALAEAVPTPTAASVLEVAGYRYWTISVADVDEVVEACRAAGAEVLMPPAVTLPGHRVAVVADPDGNAVELLTLE